MYKIRYKGEREGTPGGGPENRDPKKAASRLKKSGQVYRQYDWVRVEIGSLDSVNKSLMINKKEFPLQLLKTVSTLFNDVRNFVDENNDVIQISRDKGDLEIHIRDRSNDSNFIFNVYKPRYHQLKSIVTVLQVPKNVHSLDPLEMQCVSSSVMQMLKTWTSLIRTYNETQLTREDRILRNYENEFRQSFKMNEEGADTDPFDLEKQVILHNFLLCSIQVLKSQDNPDEEIIRDAENFIEALPRLTKNQTLDQLSNLFAKIRAKSLLLLKEIFEVGKRELFKRIITSGFDTISGYLSFLG